MLARNIKDEPIRSYADFQVDWQSIFAPLEDRKFYIDEKVSIQGDAPKSFIRLREHSDGRESGKKKRRRRISRRKCQWPGYIAKVGSKWYPVESITEHLLTRIGQTYGVRIADSQLRMVGRQVRYLSRYFLRKDETLYHGIDIFKFHLDDKFVEEIAESRKEQDVYTFQTVRTAVQDRFPQHVDEIMRDMVEMLAFDALVGNNDRHPMNWGVITATGGSKAPRFSPVFDTARALYWNMNETGIRDSLANEQKFKNYIRRTVPQIGWDHCDRIGHFELIRKIYEAYPDYRPQITTYALANKIPAVAAMIELEFRLIMSENRRKLILKCLEQRHQLLRATVKPETPSTEMRSS